MTLLTTDLGPDVATITMDDGKVNVLSPAMQAELNGALDQAESAGLAVLLAGRPGVFSAGFDLAVLRGAGDDARAMLTGGFRLAERLLSFRRPVVAACTGHAIAMASFLLLSCDYRVGARGDFRVTANEVALGLTMPHAAVEICGHRLASTHVGRVVAQAEVFAPDDAVTAGFLDEVTSPDEVLAAATERARGLAALDRSAHAHTKMRVRSEFLARLAVAIDDDDAELAALAETRG